MRIRRVVRQMPIAFLVVLAQAAVGLAVGAVLMGVGPPTSTLPGTTSTATSTTSAARAQVVVREVELMASVMGRDAGGRRLVVLKRREIAVRVTVANIGRVRAEGVTVELRGTDVASGGKVYRARHAVGVMRPGGDSRVTFAGVPGNDSAETRLVAKVTVRGAVDTRQSESSLTYIMTEPAPQPTTR